MNDRWSRERFFGRRMAAGFCMVFGVAAGLALPGMTAQAQSASEVARITQTLPEASKSVIARLSQLDELPADQRAVFIAHELDGRSFKDLAAELGVGVNTLLGRKHAAARHLRRRLQEIRSELDH